ncbi:Uncharacterised protein [Clostridium paraputrificum]|nr:Uncharacterised protein [Clostridium paraputrificum]
MHGQRQVRRQGPRGRRPGQGGGVGKLRVRGQRRLAGGTGHRAGDRERHRQRRVLAHLVRVVQARLMVRQRRVLGPRVRQDAEALVDQALVVELLERPHDRLHEVGVHGLVAVVEVDPARLAGDVLLPLVGVLQHGGGAVLVELGQAHVLDLALVGDAQLLLGLQLRGQAVAVPAEDAVDLLAAHGLVARHDVLDVAGQQVPVVRQAVGERRAVVEDVLLVAVALVDRRLESSVGGPEIEDAILQGREAGAAGDVTELVGARVGAACGGGLVHVGPPWSTGPRSQPGKVPRGRRSARYHPA